MRILEQCPALGRGTKRGQSQWFLCRRRCVSSAGPRPTLICRVLMDGTGVASSAWGKGIAGDVHLQPLPLRQGGARSHRARCGGPEALGGTAWRSCRTIRPTIRKTRSPTCAMVAEHNRFPFPICWTSRRGGQGLWGVCTPDFFGYNAAGELQYRGRLDASRKDAAPAEARRELFEAIRQVAETGCGPDEQVPVWAVRSNGLTDPKNVSKNNCLTGIWSGFPALMGVLEYSGNPPCPLRSPESEYPTFLRSSGWDRVVGRTAPRIGATHRRHRMR